MNKNYFIPARVLHTITPPFFNWETGTILFADVSGFTPLSESLAAFGPAGAEELTNTLNRYFERMIELIHQWGGEVMKFGGDAILCYFRGSSSLLPALQCAQLMQEKMVYFQKMKTSAGVFPLKMKIGVSHGKIMLGAVGDKRADVLFAGRAVDLSSEAEHHANKDEIVLCAEKLPPGVKGYKIEEGFFHVESTSRTSFQASVFPSEQFSDAYFIPALIPYITSEHWLQMNMLKEVVPIFFQFSGFIYNEKEFDWELFQAFFSMLVNSAKEMGGNLNRIAMGDKGSTFFFLFGAPDSLEQKELMASQWVLDAAKKLHRAFPSISWKMGINTGKVFAGIVGGHQRYDYTVMGDTVNFAARLMQGAALNTCNVSRFYHDRTTSVFQYYQLGEHKFKGKKQKQSVYMLIERKRHQEISLSKEPLIGRVNEWNELQTYLDKARQKEPSLVFLEGEAGSGKTFFVNKFCNNALQNGWTINSIQGEITLQNREFAAWKPIFNKIFFAETSPNYKTFHNFFAQNYPDYLSQISLIAPLFDLKTSKELEFDDKTKKQIINYILSNVLIDALKKELSILFIDDLQWFDSRSLELLKGIISYFSSESILLIVTVRSGWEREVFLELPLCKFISINNLSEADIKLLIEHHLNEKADESIVKKIFEKTQGNPFFAKEVAQYLKRNELLVKRLEKWYLKRGKEELIKLSNEEIFLSCLDSLSPLEQRYLQFCTCIGPTLNLAILKISLGKSFSEGTFQALISAGLILPLDEQNYKFRHNLVQDTIYQAIPLERRKKIHRKIGYAMETYFSKTINTYAPNLANHFYASKNREKAYYYARIAGLNLFKQNSFPEASMFLERAYNLLSRKRLIERWEIGIQCCDAFIRAGRLEDARKLAKTIRKSTKRKNAFNYYMNTWISYIKASNRLGDYRFVFQTNKLINKFHNCDKQTEANFYYLIAEAYYRLGNLDKAKFFLTKSLELGYSPTFIYYYLGDIEKLFGNYDKAFEYLEKAKKVEENKVNIYQSIYIIIEIANLHSETGNRNKAKELYFEALHIAEKVGASYLIGNIYYNLASLSIDDETLDDAKEFLKASQEMLSKQGVVPALGRTHALFGYIYFMQEEYEKAYEHNLSALAAFQRSGERISLAHQYYNLAEVCTVLKKWTEGMKWLKEGLDILQPDDPPETIQLFDDLKNTFPASFIDTQIERLP